MLDVHPPHNPTHTWRDFFIHIATIVIGLLIAISLEQSVELFHHRHQVAEARRAIAEERQENIARFHKNIKAHLEAEAQLHNDLRIFLYLKAHPRAPLSALPGVLIWPIGVAEPLTAAWSTAAQTGVLELFPRSEVAADTLEYDALHSSLTAYQEAIPLQHQCVAYLTRTGDPSTLSPTEIDQEIHDLQARLSVESFYGYTLFVLARREPAYGPTPGRLQIDPFFYMGQEEKGSDAQIALTLHDMQQALSVLPRDQQTLTP
jgi:hypothetical protein